MGRLLAQTATAPPNPGEVPSELQHWLWFALILLAVIALAINGWSYVRFLTRSQRIDSELQHREVATTRSESSESAIIFASQGPVNSVAAEIQSARVRWKRAMQVFPQLALTMRGGSEEAGITVATTKYTEIPRVAEAQKLIASLVASNFDNAITPTWIERDDDFDAIRHPQLAIATPTLYTFPFFLTWQRRHQWGVLPYATHTRLGVAISVNHPRITEIKKLKDDFDKGRDAQRLAGSAYWYWMLDPRHARWIELLFDAARKGGAVADISNPLATAYAAHTPSVFSVGAYLQKEILPLACATLGDTKSAQYIASSVRQVDVTELPEVVSSPCMQNPASALIFDLAYHAEVTGKGLEVLALPHCVYVPVGIGFSIPALPLLDWDNETREWRSELLRAAGTTLIKAKDELSEIGIELDERLWKSPRPHD